MELYFHSAYMPSWHAWGQLYLHFALNRILFVRVGRRKLLRTCWLHRLTSWVTLFVSDTLFWGHGDRSYKLDASTERYNFFF